MVVLCLCKRDDCVFYFYFYVLPFKEKRIMTIFSITVFF